MMSNPVNESEPLIAIATRNCGAGGNVELIIGGARGQLVDPSLAIQTSPVKVAWPRGKLVGPMYNPEMIMRGIIIRTKRFFKL